ELGYSHLGCILPRDDGVNSGPRMLFVHRALDPNEAQTAVQQMWAWLSSWLPVNVAKPRLPVNEITLWDLFTERNLASISGDYSHLCVSGDGRKAAALNGDSRIEIWDIPPRKPLGWFLGLAGVLLLLTLGGFWWQVRRWKREAT